MLGRLFNARLKSAEHAVADGRIDDAFRLATAPDLASNGRARAVLERVGQLLFERAEQHYREGRSLEALQDLERAEQAGVPQGRIADLRAIVRAAVDESHHRHHSRRKRIEAAQDLLAQGSLRSAEQVLQHASARDVQADELRRQAADREARAVELFAEVRKLLKEKHLSTAIERYRRAARLHPGAPAAPELERLVVDRVLQTVREALLAGKLNAALESWGLLRGIGDQRPVKTELATVIETIQAASVALAAGNYEETRRKVLGLEHLLGGARWVQQACEQLGQIDELITRVHGGPLGLVRVPEPGTGRSRPAPAAWSGRLDETLVVRPASSGDSLLPERLLMLVDGSGSYLLIRSPRASIGRAATARPADIPIVSDLSERHAELARVDDDYFIFAKRDVGVGGRPVHQKVLEDGDKIVLGTRARMTFKLPSRKSTSAVLDLSGSCKLPNDVKRVILFDRFATLGRYTHAHVVVTTASEDVLLFERGGKLWVRHKANGKGDHGRPVELGEPFEYAGVSMVIEPWSVKV